MRIRLLLEAERDLEIGADFYDSQKAGLGIHEQDRGFYRSLSKRFPFSIYYKLNENCVEIYAVLDTRQDPRRIDSALESPRIG